MMKFHLFPLLLLLSLIPGRDQMYVFPVHVHVSACLALSIDEIPWLNFLLRLLLLLLSANNLLLQFSLK